MMGKHSNMGRSIGQGRSVGVYSMAQGPQSNEPFALSGQGFSNNVHLMQKNYNAALRGNHPDSAKPQADTAVRASLSQTNWN